MNQTTSRKRHFFAYYTPNGEDLKRKHRITAVIAFTCVLARENWIEFFNRDAVNSGHGILAHRATSQEIRKYFGMDKGDAFVFTPICSASRFYQPQLSDKTYYLTDVSRN